MAKRRQPVTLSNQPAWIAAAKEVLQTKQRWHKMSPSARKLTGTRGIQPVSGEVLDRDYMEHWAEQILLMDLLRPSTDS